MDPLTATLPVVPGSVHSGLATLAGMAVGQALASVAVCSTGGEPTAGVLDGEVAAGVLDGDDADEVPASEPHAVSVMAMAALQAARTTGEEMREEFTSNNATGAIRVAAGSPARVT